MGPKGALRQIQAAARRLEREAQRRRRELDRLERESAKLSALEQARLEVESYENKLDVLLSVHKEFCQQWDWIGLAAALASPCPVRLRHHELRTEQWALVAPQQSELAEAHIQQARARDEQEYRESAEAHVSEVATTEAMRDLAQRVLVGEPMAYIEAFAQLNPAAEISAVGSLKRFAVERTDLIDCLFKVNAAEVIPSEVKTLTATGKVSVRSMPRSQYHELYQDYVCACVIRMAREIFAMLPVEMVVVTAEADVIDPLTGRSSAQPVLSVAVPRSGIAGLDFERVGAGDVIDRFMHRGDFRASRKAGTFRAIVPLKPMDLHGASAETSDARELHGRVCDLRALIAADIHGVLRTGSDGTGS